MTEPTPIVEHRHPAEVVISMVDHVLAIAETWLRWDGTPNQISIEGEAPRLYTPHKAIRRVTDHLIDHLAELEAHIFDREPELDAWHGSLITTEADLTPFTVLELDEARSRLRRLATIWDVRLRSLTDVELDRAKGDSWTPRQIALHLGESVFYADSVGRLAN
jgi:hypothetical protein